MGDAFDMAYETIKKRDAEIEALRAENARLQERVLIRNQFINAEGLFADFSLFLSRIKGTDQ